MTLGPLKVFTKEDPVLDELGSNNSIQGPTVNSSFKNVTIGTVMKNVSAGPFDSGNTATLMSQRIELSKNISNFQNISSICTTPSIAVKIATLAYPPGFFGPIIGVLTANFLYKHKFSTKPWPLVVVSAYFFSVVPFMPFFSMDYKKFETDTYWIYLSIGVFFSSMRMGLDQDFTNRLIKYSKRGTAFAVKYWTGKIVLMFLVYAAGVMVQNDTIDRIDRKLVELNSDRMSDMEYQIIRFRAMQKALMTTLPTMFVSIIFYAGGYIFYDIDDPDWGGVGLFVFFFWRYFFLEKE